MILIDTNIVSEMMKSAPDAKVIQWIDQQDTLQLYIATITIAEIAYGLHVLPAGSRRQLLETAFEKAIIGAFQQRIVPFDETAAYLYGKIMARRKQIGRPMSIPDGQIAAIAQAQNFSVATRNVADFKDCDLPIINPFQISKI